MTDAVAGQGRRPGFLRPPTMDAALLGRINGRIRRMGLATVCESARCPNRPVCYAEPTVTFMVMGNTCTRRCSFCAVDKGRPDAIDPGEPARIAAAVRELGLKYAVITSVTRDDLAEGGAAHFAAVIAAVAAGSPGVPVEVLVPDFRGDMKALEAVVDAGPAVLNHNLETVPRLYQQVRPGADYRRSLGLLEQAKRLDNKLITKSGIMLGLGESRREVIKVMSDLNAAGCDLLTIGQYLPPSLGHHPLVRYARPEEYEDYRSMGREMGFRAVMAGPLVRSSFHAAASMGAAAR